MRMDAFIRSKLEKIAGLTSHLLERRAVGNLSTVGGILLVAGIWVMHYSGTATTHIAAEEQYGHILLGASIVVALFFSINALHIIAENKNTEIQNHRLARIVEDSINEVYVFDAETLNFIQANASACENLGYTREELVNLTPLDLKPEHTSDTFTDLIAPLRNGQTDHIKFETIHRRKDGSLYDAVVTLQQIQSKDRPVFAAIIEDITERKKAEEILRQQNEELSFLINAAPGVLYTCKPEGDFAATFISSSVKTQLIYDPGDFTDDPGFWANHIHPEDKEKVFAGLDALFERGHHTHEYRFRHGDGSYHWMHDQLSLLRDCDGKAERIVGFWNDITERKKAEETLQRQNEELRKRDKELNEQNERFNAALENMSQGLCMFDGEQRLVVCNERFGTIYGLSPEQMKPGTTLREIMEYRLASGDYAEADAEAYIEQSLAEAASGTFEKKARQLSDGRIVEITRHPMPGGGWVTTHEDITELRRIEARLAHMAHHDALTGLPNRAQLRERLDEELKRAKRSEPFAVLCLDLDQFKNVNDTLGHPAGDELLKSVAERLRNCGRETNLVARLGGDEFAIIQVAAGQPGDVAALAGRICEAISAPFKIEDNEVFIETSIGITIAPDDGTDPDELLKKADMALYRSKTEGPGAFCFFEPALEANLKARHALGLDLRKALPNGELEVQYQPLINLHENKVSGFEALLRWTHPEHGMVSPDNFIPLAEQMGLINIIGEWVLHQACMDAASWPSDLKVAVNISPVQFRDSNLVRAVVGTLEEAGLPSSRLELEITESVLLQDNDMTLTKLHHLRNLGVQVSMDDFGTGYSSLSYLTSFPFDKIKIDSSFISGLCRGSQDAGILQAIVSLASNLGVTTTAEGVETKGQLEIIRTEGCAEAQGFLFSHPMPAGEISEFLLQDLEFSKRMESAA